MDRIEKALKKLTEKERKQIKALLLLLKRGDVLGLDIKKLKGHDSLFRARKGDLRVIYRQGKEDFFLLAIERRSEKTYRDV